jgi:hypothetical protein
MTDIILGLPVLQGNDSPDVVWQNRRNLVMARLAVDPRIADNSLSAPPVSVQEGHAYIISGTATGLWAGQAANTVAVALSTDPTSVDGWFFYPPTAGLRVWIVAGSPTGHRVWSGSSWDAV